MSEKEEACHQQEQRKRTATGIMFWSLLISSKLPVTKGGIYEGINSKGEIKSSHLRNGAKPENIIKCLGLQLKQKIEILFPLEVTLDFFCCPSF